MFGKTDFDHLLRYCSRNPVHMITACGLDFGYAIMNITICCIFVRKVLLIRFVHCIPRDSIIILHTSMNLSIINSVLSMMFVPSQKLT